MLSYIGPRRSGKTTFAIERFLKDPEHTLLVTGYHNQCNIIRGELKQILRDRGGLVSSCHNAFPHLNNVVAVGDVKYHIQGKKYKKIIFDEIEFCLQHLLDCRDISIDLITGTAQRVKPRKEFTDVEREEYLKRLMPLDWYNTEILAEYKE